ncbi:hypothetical protein GIB67_032801 [Kingdonia uniflora]|uniref:peptidylprolyl isomerase n=1 Tax=Kingdonia uniflora TaxID=39325 RepID=A0A7J7MWH1_9MAGN|nr:hypothetical protein GIB67_032801 [Kingdonia uniflora]
MELLSSTILNFKHSLSSSRIQLSRSSLQLKNNITYPQKLTFPSRQFLISLPPTQRVPSQLSVSASSVATTPTVKDKLPADIEVEEIQEPNSRVRISVSVPPVVCEDCYKRVLAEFTKRAKVTGSLVFAPIEILLVKEEEKGEEMGEGPRVYACVVPSSEVPGFRPGKKVPENILISHVGKQNVRKATIESILKRTIPHAMSSVEGRALKDSVHIITKFSEMEESFASPVDFLRDVGDNIVPPQLGTTSGYGKLRSRIQSLKTGMPHQYDVMVDVAPELKWIPENGYRNLKIIVEMDNFIDAQTACEAEIKRRHKALGALRIVTDRGLQVGDVAILDISTTKIKEDESDGEKIPSAESNGFQLDTEEVDSLPPGFLDSLLGIQSGQTKSFSLVFPDSWRQENLRGVPALFTVDCKELFYRDLPVLDDSLAEKFLPGCSTLSQVRESILLKCKEVEETAKEQATDNAILDQLCKMIDVEIPTTLFEEQGRQLYGAQLLQIQANMKISEEQLSYISSPKAVNEFLEVQRENITNAVKQNLAVTDIFKRENLEYPTEVLVKEIENSIAEFKRNKQEYDEERVKDQVEEILEGAKVLEWLREHAEVQYITR